MLLFIETKLFNFLFYTKSKVLNKRERLRDCLFIDYRCLYCVTIDSGNNILFKILILHIHVSQSRMFK